MAAVLLVVGALPACSGCGTRRPGAPELVEPRAVEGDGEAELASLESRAASRPASYEARLALGRQLHRMGADGDNGAASRAQELFEALHAERPKDAKVLAYRGSALLLEARRTLAFWNKGALANEGLRDLDTAIAAAPDDLEVRFLRAISARELPGFFGRSQQSAEDFAFLAERVEEAVRRGALDGHTASACLYTEGLLREARGDAEGARDLWRRAVDVDPRSPYAAAAQSRLDRFAWEVRASSQPAAAR